MKAKFTTITVASAVFVFCGVARAQVTWVGPFADHVVGIAPDGTNGGEWLLTGAEPGGGFGTNYVVVSNQGFPGVALKSEEVFFSGLAPSSGTGGYSISGSANGLPWVPYPFFDGSPFPVYFNEVATVSAFGQNYSRSDFEPMGNEASLSVSMSLAVGDPVHLPDIMGIDANGNIWALASGLAMTAPVPGAKKIAFFNEILSCGGVTMHQPYVVTSSNAIYRYEFDQPEGSCTPEPLSGCEYGCWEQVPGAAVDVAANDLVIGTNGGLFQWNNSTANWNAVLAQPSGHQQLVGVGAAPGYSTATPNESVAAFDSDGNWYQLCSQPFGQCGGQGWTGPSCCAFTQTNPSPTSSSAGVACIEKNTFYSQCVPN